MRKITTVFLVMLFLLVFAGTALADDTLETDPPGTRYTYLTSIEANLDIVSGTADMYASMNCAASVDSCNLSAYLQRYENGSWVTVQSYSKYSSTTTCTWSDSHSVSAGYTYRLRVYFYAWSGDVRESDVLNAY